MCTYSVLPTVFKFTKDLVEHSIRPLFDLLGISRLYSKFQVSRDKNVQFNFGNETNELTCTDYNSVLLLTSVFLLAKYTLNPPSDNTNLSTFYILYIICKNLGSVVNAHRQGQTNNNFRYTHTFTHFLVQRQCHRTLNVFSCFI